jgi:hypothetical protein
MGRAWGDGSDWDFGGSDVVVELQYSLDVYSGASVNA